MQIKHLDIHLAPQMVQTDVSAEAPAMDTSVAGTMSRLYSEAELVNDLAVKSEVAYQNKVDTSHSSTVIIDHNTPQAEPDSQSYQLSLKLGVDGKLYGVKETQDHKNLEVADIDIEDQPLNGNCLYKLSGEDIDSRWWSITAYANDGFLIENTEKLYSYNSETVNFNANGGFEIYFLGNNDFITDVSSENWLRVNQDEDFNISLRIYYPGEEFFSNLKRVNLPIVEKVKCIE